MSSKNKIFICLNNNQVIGAGNTLAKLVNNTFILAANNNYAFYYRKLKTIDEVEVLISGNVYKLIRYDYK